MWIWGAGALLGAALGGFLPRAAERLSVPYGEPWRDACSRCGSPFAPGGRRAWVRFGRSCGGCGGTPRPWLPAVVTATVLAVLCWAVGPRADLPAYLLLGTAGVLLAVVDLRCQRLPNAVVGRTLLAELVLLALAAALTGAWGDYLTAVLGALALFGVYLLLHLASPASFGRGDVNLAAVLGLGLGWLGWGAVLLGFCATSLAGLPPSLYLLLARPRDRRPQLPYGPYLLAGALAAVVLLAA